MTFSAASDWVAANIDTELKVLRRTPEGLLVVERESNTDFLLAVIGEKEKILFEHVAPVFSYAEKPDFVVNIPSGTLWSGAAIDTIHEAPAAFGHMAEILKASRLPDVRNYRHREYNFFETAIRDHKNVKSVTRVFDSVFRAHRLKYGDLTIAMINAYNMSSEDLRDAKSRFGYFNIGVKVSSYGGITSSALRAAESMDIEALTFRELMGRLHKK